MANWTHISSHQHLCNHQTQWPPKRPSDCSCTRAARPPQAQPGPSLQCAKFSMFSILGPWESNLKWRSPSQGVTFLFDGVPRFFMTNTVVSKEVILFKVPVLLTNLGQSAELSGQAIPTPGGSGVRAKPTPIQDHPLDSCQVPELYRNSYCHNRTNISYSHLLTVCQLSAMIYVFSGYSAYPVPARTLQQKVRLFVLSWALSFFIFTSIASAML